MLALGAGVPPAEAQDVGESHAELVELLLADGLTREQLVGLYASLAGVQYQPPACVAG